MPPLLVWAELQGQVAAGNELMRQERGIPQLPAWRCQSAQRLVVTTTRVDAMLAEGVHGSTPDGLCPGRQWGGVIGRARRREGACRVLAVFSLRCCFGDSLLLYFPRLGSCCLAGFLCSTPTPRSYPAEPPHNYRPACSWTQLLAVIISCTPLSWDRWLDGRACSCGTPRAL